MIKVIMQRAVGRRLSALGQVGPKIIKMIMQLRFFSSPDPALRDQRITR
jgi:hypothetical protein